MSSTQSDRKIRDCRDLWNSYSGNNKDGCCANTAVNTTTPRISENHPDNRTKHKYKTLERHLSMKKTIRKKMMRDLREIGDATMDSNCDAGFLEQIKNDEPPPANIDKPSLWKRLTKGWGHS